MNANESNNRNIESENIRLKNESKRYKEQLTKALNEIKSKDKELNRMKDALAEYAVKEAFLKKVNALFEKNRE